LAEICRVIGWTEWYDSKNWNLFCN
jgi:hypothetical protein